MKRERERICKIKSEGGKHTLGKKKEVKMLSKIKKKQKQIEYDNK